MVPRPVINRTLVYGLLTVLLGAVYVVGVVGIGRLLNPVTGESALVQPARRRVQAVVDRRFNRRRHDAVRTVEAFSHRLRDQVELDMLSAELLTVVDQTMQPTAVSLWLSPSAQSVRPTPGAQRGCPLCGRVAHPCRPPILGQGKGPGH